MNDKERIAELADAFNKVCAENADFVAQSVTDENRIAKLEAQVKHCEGHAAELEAENKALRLDAERYRWLYPHYEVVHLLKIKAPSIPCPDKLEYCVVAHYGPVTKAMIDIAIDAAREGK